MSFYKKVGVGKVIEAELINSKFYNLLWNYFYQYEWNSLYQINFENVIKFILDNNTLYTASIEYVRLKDNIIQFNTI